MHLESITNEEINEELFFSCDSRLGRIPSIAYYGSSGWLYLSKADICIIRFWETFERILTRKSERNDMFSITGKCIHNRCRHRDGFGCFSCIHHWDRHLDCGLRSVPSEDISSQLAESITQCCPHISLDLYLSNNISTIRSYLISISLLDKCITWLLYSPYYKESSKGPDDEGDSENDEKCIHAFIVCVYEIIAKTNPRKIPKWMGRTSILYLLGKLFLFCHVNLVVFSGVIKNIHLQYQ